MSYRDRDDPKNGARYRTGDKCIEVGCPRPAGTWWSPLWCFEHNVERMDRIDAQFAAVRAELSPTPPADATEGA